MTLTQPPRAARRPGQLGWTPEQARQFLSAVGSSASAPPSTSRSSPACGGASCLLVPRITPKGLRHTAPSVGRVVGGDDKVMQERLGHADIGVTLNTYTHTVSDQHRLAGERLDGIFES